MLPLARLSAFLLVISGSVSINPAVAQVQPVPKPSGSVVEQRQTREQFHLGCAAEAAALRPQILAETIDGTEAGTAAANNGCFGMFTDLTSIPGGYPYAPGLECRPNFALFGRRQLGMVSLPTGSDVLSIPPVDPEPGISKHRVMRAFAIVYNRAVLGHPNFPYRDLCRPAAPNYRISPVSEPQEPGDWGLRPLEKTDQPRNMYEAARRGTLESLLRLIEVGSPDLHAPDVLELTPLAWAVIYHRPDHVRALLAAGAHPYGWIQTQPGQRSPLTIAQTRRDRELVSLMRPALEQRGLSMPPVPAKLDPRSTPVYTHPRTFELAVSAQGRVTGCRLAIGNARFEYPATCQLIERSVSYIPAEGPNGDAIATTMMYQSSVPMPDRTIDR